LYRPAGQAIAHWASFQAKSYQTLEVVGQSLSLGEFSSQRLSDLGVVRRAVLAGAIYLKDFHLES